ncbi:MAG TPA: hypothetical protein VNM92_09095 [Thermoanaerobaculia bacterium]|nr:hypothetical protein [Thermoanaerobaculia bacterium]
MKKIATVMFLSFLTASTSMATYIVVMKDGRRYKAKQKWTVAGGKALIALENGTTLQLDPGLIDATASDQLARSGLGDVRVLATDTPQPSSAPQRGPSLGSRTRLRTLPQEKPRPDAPPASSPAPPPPSGSKGSLGSDVITKFNDAYENIGIYEKTVTSTSPATLRVQLTADSEDKVFKVLSATSYMMTKVPGITGSKIDSVELFMSTTNGGTAGRFIMTQEDAQAILSKSSSRPEADYFVRKVIY